MKQNKATNTRQTHIIKHVYANSNLLCHVIDPDNFCSTVTKMLKIMQAHIMLI